MTDEFFGSNTQRFDWLIFLHGRPVAVSIEHNMRSGEVTLEVCGKRKKSWQVKRFADVFLVPFNLMHDGHKFTLRKRVDDEGNETENLELDIDGLEFSLHPFVSSDFVLDEEKQLIYCSGLVLNKVEVFAKNQSETWSTSMLN